MPDTYPTPEPIQLYVRIPRGHIEVVATDTQETTVDIQRTDARSASVDAEDVRIEFRDSRRTAGQLLVVADKNRHGWFTKQATYEVRIETPHGAEVDVVTASADVVGKGRFESVNARTASGDVSFENVTDRLTIKSASGDLRVHESQGSADLATTSGDIHVGAAGGRVSAALVSGDFKVDTVADGVKARSVSGDLSIQAVEKGTVELTSVSGDAVVAVRPGKRVWMDLMSSSGDTFCELDGSDDGSFAGAAEVDIRVKTVSGDVRIVRAAASV
ncbi:MAG TPA: DUF4097 family beta strand repeat-containing protein [Actinomycetota bacterium]|nr:DUF4097 family beta strand repeat-containing protein [Actinomycetota bacterium]